MHVIRHHNLADAFGLKMVKLVVQDTQENAFRVMLVEQTTTVLARGRDIMHVLLVIGNDSLSRHAETVT